MNRSVETDFIELQAERIPIAWRGEVLVVGGNAAGIAAGAASSRKRVRTMVLEKNCYLGGKVSDGAGFPVKGGFPGYVSLGGIMDELCAKLRYAQEDSAVVANIKGEGVCYYHENEYFKFLAEDLLRKSGCKWKLNVSVSDVLWKAGKISGVVTVKNMKKSAYLADVIIDATENAELAEYLGSLEKDSKKTGAFYPYILENIDTDKLIEYLKSDPKLEKAWKKASDDRELPDEKNKMWKIYPELKRGVVYGETIQVQVAEDRTEESLFEEVHQKLFQHLRFFRRYVAGMEKCRLFRCSSDIIFDLPGKIKGVQTGNAKYWEADKKFKGILRVEKEGGKQEKMPLGMIIPKNTENLLVAGRACDMDNFFREKVGTAQEMVLGQCAGICAALSVLRKVKLKELKEEEIHSLMNEVGCDIDGDLSRKYSGDIKIAGYGASLMGAKETEE